MKHPAVTSILAHLSQMHEDEIRALMGATNEGDPLPYGALASTYAVEGKGKNARVVAKLNFGRLNPTMNALIGMQHSGQSLGVFSPLVGEVVSQMLTTTPFQGKNWRIKGDAERVTGPTDPRIDLGTRGKIFGRHMASLTPLYRAYEDIKAEGRTPSEENLPLPFGLGSEKYVGFDPDGPKYDDIMRSQAKRAKETADDAEVLVRALGDPIYSTVRGRKYWAPTQDKAIAKQLREERNRRLGRKPPEGPSIPGMNFGSDYSGGYGF